MRSSDQARGVGQHRRKGRGARAQGPAVTCLGSQKPMYPGRASSWRCICCGQYRVQRGSHACAGRRCKTCGEYIYKGKKFNARKETVQNEAYLGLPIFRFYIKCTRCLAEITFKVGAASTRSQPFPLGTATEGPGRALAARPHTEKPVHLRVGPEVAE